MHLVPLIVNPFLEVDIPHEWHRDAARIVLQCQPLHLLYTLGEVIGSRVRLHLFDPLWCQAYHQIMASTTSLHPSPICQRGSGLTTSSLSNIPRMPETSPNLKLSPYCLAWASFDAKGMAGTPHLRLSQKDCPQPVSMVRHILIWQAMSSP